MLHTSSWLHDMRERLDRACEEGERVIAVSQQLRLKSDKLFERIFRDRNLEHMSLDLNRGDSLSGLVERVYRH